MLLPHHTWTALWLATMVGLDDDSHAPDTGLLGGLVIEIYIL